MAATRKIYRKTEYAQIESDLQPLVDSLCTIARGGEPPLIATHEPGRVCAPRMVAPHRMDLMVSSMVKDGAWHCNQKCLHCYAANQPLSAVPELDTDQWLAVIEKCRNAGIPQLTFTGGEPTLRHDLVKLVQAAQWFVTRLNTNGRMLTSMMCKDLHAASLDAVQITFYSADADIHNALVGVDGYTDTLNGIKNALAADLNVSLNTPLCSLNRDYLSVVRFAHELGVRYLTCSGLIPCGQCRERRQPRRAPDAGRAGGCTAPRHGEYAAANGMEINFTSPGWLQRGDAAQFGLYPDPQLWGLSVQHGDWRRTAPVLPCQSWLTGKGLGNLLRTPWPRIWHSDDCRAIRGRERQNGAPLPAGRNPDAGGLLMKMNCSAPVGALCAVLTCGMLLVSARCCRGRLMPPTPRTATWIISAAML